MARAKPSGKPKNRRRDPGGDGKRERREMLARRDGSRCVWCDLALDRHHPDFTLDHALCHGNGGSWWIGNLLLACYECNQDRLNTPLLEFYERQVQRGRSVNHGAIMAAANRLDHAWARRAVYSLRYSALSQEEAWRIGPRLGAQDTSTLHLGEGEDPERLWKLTRKGFRKQIAGQDTRAFFSGSGSLLTPVFLPACVPFPGVGVGLSAEDLRAAARGLIVPALAVA